jgi:DNA sulfur modification protein DndE
MAFNRIYVNEETEQRLRLLKARTGLTPNLICRIGLCLSLAEPGIPDHTLFPEGQAREFNRYTLTGQWDSFFFALVRERLKEDGLDPETNLETQFVAHLNRGIMLLPQRIKTLEDIPNLVKAAQRRAVISSTSEAG